MAGEIGSVFVRVRPNMAAFEAETLSGVKKTFKRAAEIAGVAYGAKATFDFVKKSADDAAAVQKSQELIRAQFGASGKAINEWADTAGIKLGVAGHETESVAARFGILFKNLGIGQKQASTMTLNMEKLGGSLAAIRGVDPGPVLERLPVAMAGNVRGLKQLGIAIDAQLIKQTALNLGYGKQVDASSKTKLSNDALAIAQARLADAESKYASNDVRVVAAHDNVTKAQAKVTAGVKTTLAALTPAQRATVIYTIATQHLGEWQKQAAAHANDYANVQRRLSAEWDRAREIIGASLLPVLVQYSSKLGDWLDKMSRSGQLQRDVNSVTQQAVAIFKAIGTAVHTAYGVFKDFSDAVGGTTRAVKLLIAAFIGFKFAQLAVAMQGLATKVGIIGSTATAAGGEVAGLRGMLLGLGAPEVLAAIAAAAGAYALFKAYTAAPPQVVGKTSVGTNIVSSNGKYYVQSPGGGRLTPMPAGYLPQGLTFTGNDNVRDLPGRNVSRGASISGSGDFADESKPLKNAIEALSKTVGAIIVDSGYRSDKHQTQLWDASVAAGHTGFMPNGNPIARPASRGGSGSDHTNGTALDGSIYYKGKLVPLSSLPASLLQRYGLTAIPNDRGHVQLIGAGTPSITTPTGSSTDTSGTGIPGLVVGKAAATVKAMTKAQLDNAKASLTSTYKSIKETASGLGVELTAKIKKDMKAASAAIGGVSNADTIAKARQGLTNLRAEVTTHMTLLRTRISLFNTFGGLKTQVAKLGSDVTPGITASMQKIRGEISKAVTPTEIAKVKTQMTTLKNAIGVQIQAIKNQAQAMTTTFDNAWSRLASGADTAFDRVTQKALAAFQATVTIGNETFQYGGSVTQTPAEKALADLQAQQQETSDTKGIADANKTLADAQAALAALKAPTDTALTAAKDAYNKLAAQLTVAQGKLDTMTADTTGKVTAAQIALQQASINVLQSNIDQSGASLDALANPSSSALTDAQQAVVDAQAQVDAALLQQKQTGLQAQAVIEREAATKQLNDQQQAYQDQRDALRTQMDDLVQGIEDGMMNGSISAADGMAKLTAVFNDPKYGIDANAGGLVIGGQFYNGISGGINATIALFDLLAAKMKKVGLLPNGNAPASTPSASPIPAALANALINPQGAFAGMTTEEIIAAYTSANDPIVAELKKQTAIAQTATTGGGGGTSVAKAVAR